MPILVIFLVWYCTKGRNNPNIFKKLEGKLGKIITALIILSVFSAFIPNLIMITMILLALLMGAAPILIVFGILAKALGGDKKKVNLSQNLDYSSERISKPHDMKRSAYTELTKAVPKRRKFVEKMNKKYDLTLTPTEINRIVDASYVSYAWEKEVYDMSQSYNHIYEWYEGETSWLRTYIKVFPIQSISSDFARQRQIVLDTYEQIFTEICPETYPDIESCIDAINNKFLINFDETTFMIAYRFLESEGKRFRLPTSAIIRNDSELDMLRQKYDADKNASEGTNQSLRI